MTAAASAAAFVTDAGDWTAPTFTRRKDFDFEILGQSEGGGCGIIWTASAEISEHFKRATAAEAAHLSGKLAEASLSKHLQARWTASSCLPFNAGDRMLDSTGMAPLCMRIEANRLEAPAANKRLRVETSCSTKMAPAADTTCSREGCSMQARIMRTKAWERNSIFKMELLPFLNRVTKASTQTT